MSFAGSLLVAAPSLVDPNFRRAVVLVCAHSTEGALGVVLNRPGELDAAEAVPELEPVLPPDAVLWEGGPVRPGGVLVLAEWEDPSDEIALVVGRVGPLGAEGTTEDLHGTTRRARAFSGFAGWGPGQLDAEVEGADWILVGAEPDDVFTGDPRGLWTAVLARQGGALTLLARMPEDPSSN